MEISKRTIDDVVVLELSGKIMGGPDASAFNDELHQLVEAGTKKIVADLSQVNWMNSSGLGILISALTTMRNAGGEMKIAAVTDSIKRLMTITKLINVFDIYDTVDQAADSFRE